MKPSLRPLAAALALAVLCPAGAVAADRGHGSDLAKARKASAPYHRLAAAKADGYGLLTDAAGIACIDNPGVGGMGVHYVNSELVADAAVDSAAPEALVYEPGRRGRLRLVAVEYVVFQQAWDAVHDSPPELFGREFHLIPEPNRYGLPAFYELHAWLWKHNPRGMFDDWNPRVSCRPACKEAER
jgi:hypothetical protein